MKSPRALVAMAAIVLGLAAVVGAVRTGPREMRTGPNGFVNSDRPSINAHNSPAAATDPTRPRVLATVNRIDSPEFSCALARSDNGGASWEPLEIPLPADAPNCYWPTSRSTTVVGCSSCSAPQGNTSTGRSACGSRPSTVRGSRRVTLSASPGSLPSRRGSPCGPSACWSWVQAGPASLERPLGLAPEPNQVVVAVSADGGRAFEQPVELAQPRRLAVQPSLVTGPDGLVIVGALDLGGDRLDYEALHDGRGGPPAEGHWRIITWASADGGATFGAPVVVSDTVVIPQRIIVEFAPTPRFARDPVTGRVYATWDAGRGDDRGVFMSWSEDGGDTWSTPSRVAERARSQFLPAVAVAPDGRVDILFYDRSADPDDVLAEVVLASSGDGGASFSTLTVSDRSFDSGIGLGSHQGLPVLATQLAVVSDEQRSAAFWADTRHGDLVTNVQDLAVALVEHGGTPRPRWWLVALGTALVAYGGLVGVQGRASHRQ